MNDFEQTDFVIIFFSFRVMIWCLQILFFIFLQLYIVIYR